MDIARLDSDQRRTFAALADTLIPAAGPMPSATAAGVAATLIDQALGFRPDLAEPFLAALATCRGQDPATVLDDLAHRAPAQFEALTVLAAGAYFTSALTQAALGRDPAPRTAHDDVDSYIDLLADVVERGFASR